MKILLVHNFYGSTAPSGENKVFEAERKMLEGHGETVEVYTRHSDEIRVGNRKEGLGIRGKIRKLHGLVKGALCTIGNPFAARQLGRKIAAFRPDVVHFHNQFPLISPLAVRAAHRSGAKVVMTLHNYRLVCAGGIPMRGGKVCRECFERVGVKSGSSRADEKFHSPTPTFNSHLSILPAIRGRCYRGSLVATLPLAINIGLYRHCWAKWVDRFIVLSEFQKKIMVECGFPEDKIVVKGNFVSRVERVEHVEKKNQVLYVGRLSDEKGIKTLLSAWGIVSSLKFLVSSDWRLVLVGDGDQRKEYEKLAEGMKVTFVGQKDHDAVLKLMAESKATVLPSEWWETFGLTVVESMMVGTPVIGSNIGALPDVVGSREYEVGSTACGEVFEAGNAEALAGAIQHLLTRPDYEKMCAACKHRVTEHYTEESNYQQLMGIYRE